MDLAQFEKWKLQVPGSPLERLLLGRLIQANEPLILKYVSRVCRTYRTDVDDDALQAGRIGCIISFRRYDPTRGHFSTFAWHHIRSEVQKHLAKHTQYTETKRGVIFSPEKLKLYRDHYKKTGGNLTWQELGVTELKFHLFHLGVHFEPIAEGNASEEDLSPALQIPSKEDDPEKALRFDRAIKLLDEYIKDLPPEQHALFIHWMQSGQVYRRNCHMHTKWLADLTVLLLDLKD